jgi:hypothetical protein
MSGCLRDARLPKLEECLQLLITESTYLEAVSVRSQRIYHVVTRDPLRYNASQFIFIANLYHLSVVSYLVKRYMKLWFTGIRQQGQPSDSFVWITEYCLEWKGNSTVRCYYTWRSCQCTCWQILHYQQTCSYSAAIQEIQQRVIFSNTDVSFS